MSALPLEHQQPSPRLFSAADFKQRALTQKGQPLHEALLEHGDHKLNHGLIRHLQTMSLKEAAVLLPIVDYEGEARVILTRRTAALRKHSGQIAFPGGKIDAGDKNAEDAALREAEEEIGLARHYVETLGVLPHYLTGTGFRITPVLSIVKPGFDLRMNRDEVDEVFEVPLSFLMDSANHQLEQRLWEGKDHYYYVMAYGPHRIWGVTAGILRMLYERLYA